MPHLAAALALLLAVGTPRLAQTHHQHFKPLSHEAVNAHQVPRRLPKPHHAVAAYSRSNATALHQTSIAPPHSRRQIAQPAALTLPKARRSRMERRFPRDRSPRRIELSVNRPLPVVALIRPTADHPRLASLPDAIVEPIILPQIYDARGRLMIPAALVGSHAILLHQNEMADEDGLGRVQNDADLDSMRSRGMLVSLPLGTGLSVDDRLPVNRRYTRPWTASFLNDLARAHYAHFHTPLQVNSAVRTVEFQQHLMHINGNAAPADGDTASPHLTGQAIDLAKRGMPLAEVAWMRGYLLPLIESGKIDVEEEFQQSCFHISVYRRYSPPSGDLYRVASHGGTSALASVLR